MRRAPHLSCKRDQINMRDYMDRQVTPPKLVTSPAWAPPPPCNQALILGLSYITSASFTHRTFMCVHTEKLRGRENKPKHNLFQNGKNKKNVNCNLFSHGASVRAFQIE